MGLQSAPLPGAGALHTHKSLKTQIKGLCKAWAWQKDDRILHALPLHHVHGIINALYCAHHSGACVEFMPKFSPDAVWNKLKVCLLLLTVTHVWSLPLAHTFTDSR